MSHPTAEEKAAARREYNLALQNIRKEYNADIRAAHKKEREAEKAAWQKYVAVVGDDI